RLIRPRTAMPFDPELPTGRLLALFCGGRTEQLGKLLLGAVLHLFGHFQVSASAATPSYADVRLGFPFGLFLFRRADVDVYATAEWARPLVRAISVCWIGPRLNNLFERTVGDWFLCLV